MNLFQSSRDRDLELLSAYIDDELSPLERAKLERRLQTDSGLRATLAGLRRVQTTLTDLPRLKPPRSFTLKPGMVGQPARQPSRLIPIFNYATTFAAIAFAVLVGAELATGPVRVAAPVPEVAVMQYAAETETGLVAQEAPAEAPLANDGIKSTTEESADATTEAFSITVTESAAEPLTGGAQAGGGGGGEPGAGGADGPGLGGGDGGAPPVAPPDTDAANIASVTVMETPTLDDTALREVAPTETPTPKQPAATPELAPAPAADSAFAFPVIRVAQVAVGGLLVLLILASIILRRR